MGRIACYHGLTGGCAVCEAMDRRRRAAEASRAQARRQPRSGAEWDAAVLAAHRQELSELAEELDAERATRGRIAAVLARASGRPRRRRGGWTA
jgi:hypothetical protein